MKEEREEHLHNIEDKLNRNVTGVCFAACVIYNAVHIARGCFRVDIESVFGKIYE